MRNYSHFAKRMSLCPIPTTPRPIFPPPLIHVLAMAAGIAAGAFLPYTIVDHPLRTLAGGLLVGTAILIFVRALRDLARAGTTFHAERAASSLVTEGVFGFSRNPIYLAMGIIHISTALLLNNLWILLLVLPAVLLMNYGVIVREEDHLRHQFGHVYEDYVREVRRWL